MENKTLEKPSWVRQKAALFSLWWRDRGIQVTTLAAALGIFFPGAIPIAVGGTIGFVLDEATSEVLDKNGMVEKKRAAAIGVDTSLLGKIRGAWKGASWHPFGPPRMPDYA